MNTFVGTTSTTSTTALQSSVGLWVGNAPTTLQQPTTHKQTSTSSTIGLAIATMLLLGSVTHELPPTFADTAEFITPSRIIERKGSALFGYKISQLQEAAVNEYLRQHVTSRDFLRDVAVIIDGIYGSNIIRDIDVVEDVDTGKPIMELTVKSGLPLNDEFDQKDQLLFKRIEAYGLAWGLCDVVISQG